MAPDPKIMKYVQQIKERKESLSKKEQEEIVKQSRTPIQLKEGETLETLCYVSDWLSIDQMKIPLKGKKQHRKKWVDLLLQHPVYEEIEELRKFFSDDDI